MFDAYSLKARLSPVVILFLPLAVIGFFYSLHFENAVHFISSIGIVGALTYLLSQLGRDQGKIKEENLWQTWGGAPTTQLLRIADKRIDEHTKQRYHERLQQLCPIKGYNVDDELNNPTCNDEAYRAWTKFLITKTRDTKQFNLLFKENTSYGFRRNLWALKPFAILILGLLTAIVYLFAAKESNSFNPKNFSVEFWYSVFGLAAILIFWIFLITENWVKIPGDGYGLRLCESIDQLT